MRKPMGWCYLGVYLDIRGVIFSCCHHRQPSKESGCCIARRQRQCPSDQLGTQFSLLSGRSFCHRCWSPSPILICVQTATGTVLSLSDTVTVQRRSSLRYKHTPMGIKVLYSQKKIISLSCAGPQSCGRTPYLGHKRAVLLLLSPEENKGCS